MLNMIRLKQSIIIATRNFHRLKKSFKIEALYFQIGN